MLANYFQLGTVSIYKIDASSRPLIDCCVDARVLFEKQPFHKISTMSLHY
jgi:hypothetical protein